MNANPCPSCGQSIPLTQNQGGTIQGCPNCGHVVAVDHAAASEIDHNWTPLELGWSLHQSVIAAFGPAIQEMQIRGKKAEGPAAYADANEPALFHRACMTGLAAVADLGRKERYSSEVRSALQDLHDYYSELLAPLQQPSQALLIASPDIRKIQHLTGMAGILHKGAQAANPQTIRGTAALGGAAFGSIIMPGVGTAIGGALGWWLGSGEAKVQDKVAIEHFQTAVRLMWSAIDDLIRNTWNRLCRRLLKKGGPDLPDAAFFETANIRWDSVRSQIPRSLRPFDRESVLEQLQTYIKDWGPHPEALAYQCRLSLAALPKNLNDLASLARRFHDLYPTNPLAFEPNARLHLERGEGKEALEWAEAGLQLAPESVALQQVRIEILGSLNRLSQAETALGHFISEGHPTSPYAYLVRGLIRGGQSAEALKQARHWIQNDGKPAVVVRDLSLFPLTASFLAEHREHLPELNKVLQGIDGSIQAIVQDYLNADSKTAFFGPLTGEPEALFREHLPLDSGEFFHFAQEWSEWALLRGFLGITNRRFLWKHGWEGITSMDWNQLQSMDVHAVKGTIHAGKYEVDLKNESLASSLANAIRENVQLIKP